MVIFLIIFFQIFILSIFFNYYFFFNLNLNRASLDLNQGDTIYVQAVRNRCGQWAINNDQGWLVYEPDLLISCTSVVSKRLFFVLLVFFTFHKRLDKIFT